MGLAIDGFHFPFYNSTGIGINFIFIFVAISNKLDFIYSAAVLPVLLAWR